MLTLMLAAACSGGDGDAADPVERAQREGVRIGVAGERPFGFLDEQGRLDGSAPTLAQAVLDRLGIDRVEGVEVEFGRLLDALDDGRVDIVAAGMFVTPERTERALFTDPHACIGTAFAVPADTPGDLEDYGSVARSGVQLGVMEGAVEGAAARAAGVPDRQIVAFADDEELVDALRSGRIGAFALSSVTVRYLARQHDDLEATPTFVPTAGGEPELGCPAFAFRPSDGELRDRFNEVLSRLEQEGRVLDLLREFGFSEAEIEAARGLTVEELVGRA